jgi:5'/3'-nucleotidase SurE
MHILVIRADGKSAPCLLALVQGLSSMGKISIFAPERNRSGCGQAKTADRPVYQNAARTWARLMHSLGKRVLRDRLFVRSTIGTVGKEIA